MGLWVFVAVQGGVLAAILFIDFGWRSGGQFGLTVGDQVLMMILYAGLLLVGIMWALALRAWRPLAVELVIPAAVGLWMLLPSIPLDPADHQDLIGATRDEVFETLDGRWIGESGDSLGTILHFHGLDVHFTDERRITHIVPGEDPVPGSESPPLDASAQQDLIGQPYRDATRALLDRGGINYGFETDSTGTYDQLNGLRVYYDGAQRVRSVTEASM
ncbi:MAG: hypothetical protein Rubg2KO_22290 [Rubricoccaceae bacterium]